MQSATRLARLPVTNARELADIIIKVRAAFYGAEGRPTDHILSAACAVAAVVEGDRLDSEFIRKCIPAAMDLILHVKEQQLRFFMKA